VSTVAETVTHSFAADGDTAPDSAAVAAVSGTDDAMSASAPTDAPKAILADRA
jgi:hypothetical protein